MSLALFCASNSLPPLLQWYVLWFCAKQRPGIRVVVAGSGVQYGPVFGCRTVKELAVALGEEPSRVEFYRDVALNVLVNNRLTTETKLFIHQSRFGN